MQKVCSESTWSQAYKICGPQGLENEDNILKTENIPDEQDFWIGIAVYSVVTEWLEGIGIIYIFQFYCKICLVLT